MNSFFFNGSKKHDSKQKDLKEKMDQESEPKKTVEEQEDDGFKEVTEAFAKYYFCTEKNVEHLFPLNMHNVNSFSDLLTIVSIISGLMERSAEDSKHLDYDIQTLVKIFDDNLKNSNQFYATSENFYENLMEILNHLQEAPKFVCKEIFVSKENENYEQIVNYAKNNIYKSDCNFEISDSFSKYNEGNIGNFCPAIFFSNNYEINENNVIVQETENGTFVYFLSEPVKFEITRLLVEKIAKTLLLKSMNYDLYQVQYEKSEN